MDKPALRISRDPLDLCVIGASEAGVAACIGASALGLTVALVDDGDADGMHNPDLLLEALRAAAARCRCGMATGAEAWPTVPAALRRAAADRRHGRLAAMNVRVVAARGRFEDRSTIVAGDHLIRARRFILAVGGRQPSAAITRPLDPARCLTVAALSRLAAVPPSIIVVGGGAEAVAAAQGLHRLGARTVLVADRLLPRFDPELARPLLTELARDGLHVAEGVAPQLCRPGSECVSVQLSDGTTLDASHLLLAEEPVPDLDGLDLPRAGIVPRNGEVALDRHGRTANRRVFAVGRIAGAADTAAGVSQVGRVLQAAFFPVPPRARPHRLAMVTATEPQVAMIGCTEQAVAAQGPVRVWRWPLSQTGAGVLACTGAGLIKVVTDPRGRILGVGLVGPNVREMVGFWSLAVARRLTLSDLVDVGLPSPSLSEAARALALSHVAARLGRPIVRRAIRLARRFG